MKTRELIRQLREADPTGELEVCVRNVDILLVECLPAYYDGCCEVLVRDESMAGYNVVGGEIRDRGEKVQIHTHEIEWAILDHPDLPVTCPASYSGTVERWRREAREQPSIHRGS